MVVVENEEAPSNKLTYKIHSATTLLEVETEVWVVTQLDMLKELKVQILARLWLR